jgi:hypothetical protein
VAAVFDGKGGEADDFDPAGFSEIHRPACFHNDSRRASISSAAHDEEPDEVEAVVGWVAGAGGNELADDFDLTRVDESA